MEITQMVDKAIKNGIDVVVDLENKNLRIGNKVIIHEGFPCHGYVLDFPKVTSEVALEELKFLYHKYKYSVPSERSMKKHKRYFPALPLDKLDDDCFVNADDRIECMTRLETRLLFHSIIGNLEWLDAYGNWFYKNEDFILMKTWF